MPTQTYTFFQDYKLYISLLGGDNAASNKVEINWDPTKTTISSTILDVRIWAQEGTVADILFNGYRIFAVDASLTPGGNQLIDSQDVVGYLKNGVNEVIVRVWKSPWLPLDKRGEFTAILNITFEGIYPNIEPWWKKYLLPIAVGASSLFGGILLILALQRRK